MKLAAIVNPMSRSVPENGLDLLQSELKSSPHTLIDIIPVEHDVPGAVKRCLAVDADAVIAWGGDGTLGCVLSAAGPSGPPILALPGGTMNMLPNRLYGQLRWDEILDRALRGITAEAVCAGVVGQDRFYVAALFGRLTAIADTREAIRKGDLAQAGHHLMEGEILDMETRLQVECSGHPHAHKIDAVAAAVVLPGYDATRFKVGAIDPDSTLELLATGLSAMINGWQDADAVESDRCSEVVITDRTQENIPATLDGERKWYDGACRIHLIERAARVLTFGDSS